MKRYTRRKDVSSAKTGGRMYACDLRKFWLEMACIEMILIGKRSRCIPKFICNARKVCGCCTVFAGVYPHLGITGTLPISYHKYEYICEIDIYEV